MGILSGSTMKQLKKISSMVESTLIGGETDAMADLYSGKSYTGMGPCDCASGDCDCDGSIYH